MSMAASSTYSGTAPSKTEGGHGIGTKIAAVVAALAVGLGAYWTVGRLTGSAAAEGYGVRWRAVPGGMLRVDGASKVKSRPGARGDFKRFQVLVTVASESDELVVDASSFRIDGYHVYLGMEPVSSKPTIKKLGQGERKRFRLTYQVTKEATDFSMIFEGSRDPIPFSLTTTNG